jgi:copper chaperone
MIELKIKGMTCAHCVAAVRDALAAVPGVERVAVVELESGRAVVEGDPDPAALLSAIAGAGYQARVS